MTSYYPFIRGKQYDLLAFREIEDYSIFDEVHPVIEPVRHPKGSLLRLCEHFVTHQIQFTLLITPQVVDGLDSDILDFISEQPSFSKVMTLGIALTNKVNLESILSFISESKWSNKQIHIFHTDSTLIQSEGLTKLAAWRPGLLHFVKNKFQIREYDDLFPDAKSIWLQDDFDSKNRNKDYPDGESTPISINYKYFREDGFEGFGDYLIIGDNFSVGGWSPYAVAIHLTYNDGRSLRVFHAVSDSNDDPQDIAGKFIEALSKVIDFVELKELDNPAIQIFKKLFINQTFPGLGSVKKISIQNHVYVMYDAIRNL